MARIIYIRKVLTPKTSGCLAVQLNDYDRNITWVEGQINLVHAQLKNHSPATQQQMLEEIKAECGIPISLVDFTDTDPTSKQRTELLTGNIIAIGPGKNGERYFKLVDTKLSLLQFGPIPFPIIFGLLSFLLSVLLLLLRAAVVSIWIRPLWQDLKELIKASNTIADGKLSARVNSKSLSMIRPVITGFNRMAAQTERTIEFQQSLTSAVSHELRTPLARVKFSLQMAKSADSESSRRRHFDNITTAVHELNQLVEELLTFTRHDYTDGKFDMGGLPNVALNDWLMQQTTRAQRGLKESISLSCNTAISDSEEASFHSRLMSYAVSNGISNAARFANSRVDVDLFRDGDEYIIHIDDDGPGIPEDQHKSVFDPFY